MTVGEPVGCANGSTPSSASQKEEPAQGWLLFLAGDVGVEPTSKVLETFILADVLIPCTRFIVPYSKGYLRFDGSAR